ncbi:MAG: acetyltransferase, partial [Pseudomonadota bacterium]
GEEMQEAESFAKARLAFPSDEPLPRCWTDPNYKQG